MLRRGKRCSTHGHDQLRAGSLAATMHVTAYTLHQLRLADRADKKHSESNCLWNSCSDIILAIAGRSYFSRHIKTSILLLLRRHAGRSLTYVSMLPNLNHYHRSQDPEVPAVQFPTKTLSLRSKTSLILNEEKHCKSLLPNIVIYKC